MNNEMILAFASTGLMVLSIAWMLVRTRASQRQVNELRQALIRLEDLVHAQNTGIKGIGSSLSGLQLRQQSVADRLEQLEQDSKLSSNAAVVSGSQVYRQAINLAVSGAEPAELAQRFGLSRGEAELMVSFHQLGEKVA
ncbi:MAG: DUF2802 domain-containing protein [Immundisolibacteraceae bacterium]|nr:DUF2802 domain-containing protein [Immundisolibacteraceae bacterium]